MMPNYDFQDLLILACNNITTNRVTERTTQIIFVCFTRDKNVNMIFLSGH